MRIFGVALGVFAVALTSCSAKPERVKLGRGNVEVEQPVIDEGEVGESDVVKDDAPVKNCDGLDAACLALKFNEESKCTVKFSKNQNGLKILTNEEIKNSIQQGLGVDVAMLIRDLPSRNAGTKFDNATARGPLSTNLIENWAEISIAIAKLFVESGKPFTDLVDCNKADRSCSDKIVDSVALGLWRAPASAADKELFFKLFSSANGNFAEAAQRVVAGLLLDPRFLYKIDSNDGEGISAFDLASRMSYFIWRSAPDKILLAKAADGTLLDPEVRSKEFDRMVALPEADAAFRHYMSEWLALGNLDNLSISGEMIDPAAMRKDVLDKLSSLIFQTDADVRTAFGMGKENIMMMPGLLGSLNVSSQTNPVKRGLYFSSRILCRQVPRPPADAGAFKAEILKPGTTPRERLILHETEPTCAVCHATVDPIGLGLETFDALGRERSVYETMTPIDAKGSMRLDGKAFAFEDAHSLMNAIGSSEDFTACMTVTLTEFALGSVPESTNSCELSKTQVAFAKSGYQWKALMKAIVESPSFNRKVSP